MIFLDDFSLWNKDRKILSHAKLHIGPCESVALMGLSGSGKTSLAHFLLGLLDARHTLSLSRKRDEWRWSGKAEVFGIDLRHATKANWDLLRSRRIGFLPQGLADALNPQLTVRHQMMSALQGNRHCTLGDLCARVSLPETLLGRRAKSLSGGEAQRVLLALSLAHNPDFLILDEPTSALDVKTREAVMSSLLQDQKSRTQFIITHTAEVAEKLANRTIYLRDGVLSDTPSADPDNLLSTGEISSAETSQNLSDGLRVTGLRKTFGQRMILNNLDLSLPRGRAIAIHGDSGAGKSTLARIIAGFIHADHGQITWQGQSKTPPVCGLISQNPRQALAPHFTVMDVMHEALCLQTLPSLSTTEIDETAKRYLNQVGLPILPSFIKRRARSLSGGEAQRLVIARTIAQKPDILIADEATASLPTSSSSRVLALLRTLVCQQGLSLVLLTHDQAAHRQIGCAALRLEEGHLVSEGPY